MEKYRIDTCKNGITIYKQSSEDITHTYIIATLVVKVGSMNDPTGYEGMAHFVEHMNMNFHRFQLTSLSKECSVRGYTNYYETMYVIQAEKSDEAVICDVLSRLIHGDYLLEDKIDVVRDDVLREYNMLTESTSHKVGTVLYNNSSYEKHIPIGTKDGIESIHIEDVRKFFQTRYRPERMAILLDGYVNLNKVKKRIAEFQCYEQHEKIEIDVKNSLSMIPIESFWKPSNIQNIDMKDHKVSVIDENERFVKMVFCYEYKELLNLLKLENTGMLQCVLDLLCDILFFTLSEYLNKDYNDIICNTVDFTEQIVLVSVNLYYNDLEEKKKIQEQMYPQKLQQLVVLWVEHYYNDLIEKYRNLVDDVSYCEENDKVLNKMKYHFLYKRPINTKEEERLLCKRLLNELSEEMLSVMLKELLYSGTRGYVETEYVPLSH